MQDKWYLSDVVKGIFFMVLHAFCMSCTLVLSKKVSLVLSPEQVTFLYKGTVLMIILPFCLSKGFFSVLKTKRLLLHFIRSLSSTIATVCFYYGVRKIPIVDASSITYFEQVIVCLIGIFYFRETFTGAKMVLIISGIVGAIIIIQPGFASFNFHYLFVLLAVLFWAINNTSVKILGGTERTITQLFYTSFFGTLISFVISPSGCTFSLNIKPIYILYTFLAALGYLVHTIAFFKAFRFADVSTVMPFDYTRLIFTTLLGYAALGEMPKKSSFIGCVLIVIGGLYLLYDESKRRKNISKR